MRTQAKILSKYLHTIGQGRVEWIGLRPERKSPMRVVKQAMAIQSKGLEGDRQGLKASGSTRQITLVNKEDIDALCGLMGLDAIDPSLLRRNIVVSGINLHALRHQTLQIGQARVRIGAHCHPCTRMEQVLGAGALMNMYGHGGYCAEVLETGLIAVGNSVCVVSDVAQ